ncbi:MAG: hypothetical protein COA69_01415 [Robiginitomaculum sp.]|nr:MAG: hypothetical protein COA69_01415 [Robiginitomaculum sp.]
MNLKPIILEDPIANVLRSKAFNKRLMALMSVLTVLSLLVVSVYFYGVFKDEERAIESRLETVTELRRAAISRFMTSQDQETRLWAAHESIHATAEALFECWARLDGQERQDIRRLYARGGEGLQADLQTGSDAVQAYKKMHARAHKVLKAFKEHHEYYDVFLFNADGDLVYSVEKEDDFGLNFSAEGDQYKNSGLGQVFREAFTSQEQASSFVDFLPYAPSNDDAASFLARPILSQEGDVIGVYAIQVPTDNFNAKLQYASGLGNTGETYLVGEDLLMRNDSRLSEAHTALMRTVDTDIVRDALQGHDVLRKGINFNGKTTLAAAKPMDFNGIRWAVVTEVESAELWAPFRPYILFYMVAMLFVVTFAILQYLLLRIKTGRRIAV